ncbi:ras-related C3 botulinum toxin substrate 1-like [Diabrotica virgifera virgifera]|uniref:Uncharacterized protein n=1 Tax=Diabrotica virgifera virgifera TaxID=50390 RepID=A0ABM5KU20_DIAVI|nr:ras-related C3 botulinum toxin substrate 1-like [Diabrotica virgifera virgifera]
MNEIVCVTVGDKSVGLKSLLITYTTKVYPADYVPSVFDSYTQNIVLDGEFINLSLNTVACQDDYKKFRQLTYQKANVFLLGFSIGHPGSLENLQKVWVPEIRETCPSTPIVIVGLQKDLRNDPYYIKALEQKHLKSISYSDGVETAKRLGAASYIECSALKQEGVKEVFEDVIKAFKADQSRKNKCIRVT